MHFDRDEIFGILKKSKTPDDAWRRTEKIYSETARHTRSMLGDLLLEYAKETDDGISAPYAFAFAARCWLSASENWNDSDSIEIFSKLSLNEKIEDTLSNSKIMNIRSNYFYLITKGLLNYINGDLDFAYKNFMLAATPRDFKKFVIGEFGAGASSARLFPRPSDLSTARGRKLPRVLTPQSEPPRGGTLALSVSANSVYAEAFFSDWIRDLNKLSSGIFLHLNLCLLPGEDENSARHFYRKIISNHNASTSRIFLTTMAFKEFDTAAFASARFLCGADAFRNLKCPILFCDADMQVMNPGQFHSLLNTECTIIKARFNSGPNGGYLPWRRFSAGRVFINSALSAEFIENVGDCIEYFWHDDNERNWWVDQLSLETTRLLYKKNVIPLEFRPLDTSIDKAVNQNDHLKWDRLSQVGRVVDLVKHGSGLRAAISAAAKTPMA